MQNDVLQVEYAGEGGQCQHKVPAGEQDLGVPGDPILGRTGRVERQAGIGHPKLVGSNTGIVAKVLFCHIGNSKK